MKRQQVDAFFSHMSNQINHAPQESIKGLIERAGGIDAVFLIFVDILKGFCEQGSLASPRVNEMVKPVKEISERLLEAGLPTENLIFLNDHHPQDAVEFSAFAPHCVAGSSEVEVVEPLQAIQRLEGAQTYLKNATNGLFGQDKDGQRFFEWLEKRFKMGKSLFLVVGDCTDLCIYQNAMGIRLLANQHNADVEVVVPVSHVRTYDISVEQAKSLQVPAHDGDVMDTIFLYHMQLNGVRIIQSIAG